MTRIFFYRIFVFVIREVFYLVMILTSSSVVFGTVCMWINPNICLTFFRYARSVGAKLYHTSAKLHKGIDEMFLDLAKSKIHFLLILFDIH